MPFVPVPKTAAVAIRGLLYGKPVQTDFNFFSDLGVQSDNLNDLLQALTSSWVAGALDLIPNAYQFIQTYGYDAGSPTGIVDSVNLVSPQPGRKLGIPMPANVSLFFNSKTGFRKRGSTGGIYWPCFIEDEVTANTVSNTIISSITSFLSEYIGPGAVASGWTLVAVSKFINNAPRAVGIVSPIIDWLVNDAVIDSQRRRLPKRSS